MDSVNHPSHYNAYKGIEVIDLAEQMNFNRGNAVKYIARAGLKNEETEIEDLKKAAWYIQREIERLGGEKADPSQTSNTSICKCANQHPDPETGSMHSCDLPRGHQTESSCMCSCGERWGFIKTISSHEKITESISLFLATTGDRDDRFDEDRYRLIDGTHRICHQFTPPFAIFDLTQVKTDEDAEKLVDFFKEQIKKARESSEDETLSFKEVAGHFLAPEPEMTKYLDERPVRENIPEDFHIRVNHDS